jgi:hypothetical protein
MEAVGSQIQTVKAVGSYFLIEQTVRRVLFPKRWRLWNSITLLVDTVESHKKRQNAKGPRYRGRWRLYDAISRWPKAVGSQKYTDRFRL